MGKTGTFFLAAVLAAPLGLAAGEASANGAFMETGGRTTQPVGHYDLCRRMPQECNVRSSRTRPVELTRALWKTIIDVNNAVNAAIAPRTDFEMWGVEEFWSYPVNGYGDCEDYALEKRRLLVKAGIPIGNLAVTVVRQPNGDGHAVLTVTTSMGDFILDNLEPRVLAWTETEYQFLKRQSPTHTGLWVSIEDSRNLLVGSVR